MNEEQQRAPKRPPRRRGGLARFFRGYLMIAGAVATAYALVRLIALLLVKVNLWIPPTV